MEAEEAVELTFSQNDYESQRRQTLQDLFDYGVSAYKDYRDGELVGFRRVDPRRLILSYCTYPDFRDLRYAGEILEVPVAQVIQMSNGELSSEDIEMIYKYASTNQWRPSTPVGNAYYGSYSDFWNRLSSPNIRKDVLLPCTEHIYWLTKGKPKVFKEQITKEFHSEVWVINADRNTLHPAPFPKKLVENCILLTTEENDLCLDPFLGSGTSAVVSKKLNRNFIGIEIDQKYMDQTNSVLNN